MKVTRRSDITLYWSSGWAVFKGERLVWEVSWGVCLRHEVTHSSQHSDTLSQHLKQLQCSTLFSNGRLTENPGVQPNSLPVKNTQKGWRISNSGLGLLLSAGLSRTNDFSQKPGSCCRLMKHFSLKKNSHVWRFCPYLTLTPCSPT